MTAFFSEMSSCPKSHPFAYLGGERCCRAKFKLTTNAQSDCDGFSINFESQCCSNDDSVPCSKYGDRNCQNYESEKKSMFSQAF